MALFNGGRFDEKIFNGGGHHNSNVARREAGGFPAAAGFLQRGAVLLWPPEDHAN